MSRQCACVCWFLLMLFTFCIEKANSHLPFSTENTVNSHHEGDKYSLVSDKDEAAEAMAPAALSVVDNVTTIHQHYHTEANHWDRRGRQRRRRYVCLAKRPSIYDVVSKSESFDHLPSLAIFLKSCGFYAIFGSPSSLLEMTSSMKGP